MLLGILSDTHHLLRPEVLTAFAGVDRILHAGDVGDPAILDHLRTIAPVTAIRGNIDSSDTAGRCAHLPATEVLDLDGTLLYMLHSLADLDLNPAAAGISVVLSGHTHKPLIETRNGVLYLNPGSCGPRRFHLPITVALLRLEAGKPTAHLIPLPI